MSSASLPKVLLPKIQSAFKALPKQILAHADIKTVLDGQRAEWNLGPTTIHQFLELLTNAAIIREIKLDFSARPVYRYVSTDPPVFDLVQSINEHGYFCHFTAMQMHNLTTQVPKTIYFNIEQPNKSGGGTLTQAGIDRAFSGKCRTSKNIATYRDRTICLINGGNTGKLGVMSLKTHDSKSEVRVTGLERTLLDATVRPIYAGGVFEVARAFEAARDRVSANKLAAILRTVNYTYPYHQSIGFYMSRAGFKTSQIDIMRRFKIEFDFYLDYHMKDKDYNKEWRLFVPKGF